MKKISIFLLLFIVQYNLPQLLHARSAIKVGIYDNAPMMSADADGKGKGFFADIIEYVASKEGWEIKYVPGTWQQCLDKLKNNQIDILAVIAFSKTRDELYDFNKENLLTNWGQLYTSSDSNIKEITDVSGKKIAVLKNDIHYKIFKEIATSFGIECELIEAENYHAVLDLVSNNQADAGVVNRLFGMKYGTEYHVDKSGVIFNPIKIHFAVPEGKNRELISSLDKHIKLLKEDENSVYYQSLDTWFGTISPKWLFPAWSKWLLFTSLGSIGLLFLGTVVLRRQVNTKTSDLTIELKRRKNAEKTLRESQERFKTLSNITFEGIVIHDDGVLIDSNDAATKMFGYTREELTGQNFIQLCVLKEYFAIIQENIIKNFAKPYEVMAKRKDGTVFPLEIEARDIDENGKNFRVAAFRDITDRKNLESRLQQAQKMEAIGTLAGGIAHDFNNILGAIIGYTELAKDASPKDSTLANDLDKVLEAGNRATDLVKQILAFSRQGETEQILLQPANIVKKAVTMLRPTLPTTIEINQNIDTGTGFVFADPTQIHQILMNLCTNAFHAMEETGGKLDISLKETYLSDDDLTHERHIEAGTFIQLSVCDSGSGMTQEARNKLFDPYFTTKEIGKGTGLGLSIVHGIVKSYGGFITVYSKLGEGTAFHIFIPVTKKEVLLDNEAIRHIPVGKENILFIDDEKILADMGKHTLERLGYHVTVRSSSLEALETFQKQPDQYDIVITDQTMPGMTGTDIARRMLQIRPDIPIILCTGYSTIISEEKAKSMGIREFAMKPLSKKDIAHLIRKVLDDKK